MKQSGKKTNRSTSPRALRQQWALKRRSAPGAFTLIELLVALAILTLLAALLLPVLVQAKTKALQTKCVNNNRQIGFAFAMYAEDCGDSYPTHPDWASAGGKDGSYYVFVAATNRPLNRYAQNYEVFHCPADKGDFWVGSIPQCYASYGNSYLVQWASDSYLPAYPQDPTKAYLFRVLGVTAATADARKPLKVSELARSPANKIIQGDWNWHPNRGTSNSRVIWHNYKGKSLSVMLYGDGHAGGYRFARDLHCQERSPAPDPGYLFW